MRRFLACLTVILCLAAGAPLALAQQPSSSKSAPKSSPTSSPTSAPKAEAQTPIIPRAQQAALSDVVEYIRLFGYREMLELSSERQLASIVDAVRQERPDVSIETLAIIHQELRTEMQAASERSVREMAGVFQLRLNREDIAYLLTVGRDPRMQKVVRLQPQIALDLEGIGDRLADDISAKAAPRIEERLRQLDPDMKS